MPLVLVTANRANKTLTDEFLKVFNLRLRRMVAKALDCQHPDGRLGQADITVEVRDWRPEVDVSEVGVSSVDLHIVVLANDFPARRKDLTQRVESLKNAISDELGGRVKGDVWVRLCPGEFAQF